MDSKLRKQPGAFMTSYHRTELFAALYGGATRLLRRSHQGQDL